MLITLRLQPSLPNIYNKYSFGINKFIYIICNVICDYDQLIIYIILLSLLRIPPDLRL